MSQPGHTPVIPAFHETAPLTVRVETSLYAEVSNHLIMVDYAAVGAAAPTPWAWEVWSRFEETERTLMRDLHCVLIHGLALQEYWFNHAEPVSTWADLLHSVEAIADNDLQCLVAESMVSGIRYYLQEMTPQPQIDALLPSNPEKLSVDELLSDPELLKSTAAANHLSWGVSQDRLGDVLAVVLNPDNLRSALLLLLEALRKRGSENACEAARPTHNAWMRSAQTTIRGNQWTNAIDAAKALTGRKPPVAEVNRVDLHEARELVLIPCSHLGSSQRLTRAGSRHIIMFEPSATISTSRATDQPALSEAVNLMRAITDSSAFSLVQSLANGDEKYALQIADETQVHQSTVSRHLAMLERSGAVEVRPQGKAKYYRLDTDRIRNAIAVIQQTLIPDADI